MVLIRPGKTYHVVRNNEMILINYHRITRNIFFIYEKKTMQLKHKLKSRFISISISSNIIKGTLQLLNNIYNNKIGTLLRQSI